MYNQGKKTVIRMLGRYYYCYYKISNPSGNIHCTNHHSFIFPVAVVVAFFICWIPFHSQRLMFVVVTLYREWTVGLQQVTYFCPAYFVIGNLISGPARVVHGVRCLLLLQLHPQPDSVHHHVQEVPKGLQ